MSSDDMSFSSSFELDNGDFNDDFRDVMSAEGSLFACDPPLPCEAADVPQAQRIVLRHDEEKHWLSCLSKRWLLAVILLKKEPASSFLGEVMV